MGILRRPRKDNPPEEIPERNESEDEEEDSDAELSEGTEPGSPPLAPCQAPPTPPELRALREQNERLERDLQGYGISSDKMKDIAESMRNQVEKIEKELKRIKAKYAEEGMSCATSSRMATYAGVGSALTAAGGSMASSTGDGLLSLPRIGNDDTDETRRYTPIDEIAREVQKVADEIEAATGLTLTTTSSTEENEEESEEPAKKKEKVGDGDHDRDHSPPTN